MSGKLNEASKIGTISGRSQWTYVDQAVSDDFITPIVVDPTINSQNITYKYSYISTEKQAPAYNLNTPYPR